jgi:hypothetical protein
MKRYLPMSKDELGYDMQATVVEDPDGPYVLFSDHESAVASCRKEWFDKGRNSVLRNNESGCCCLFNEQDEIVSVCMAHKELLAEKDKKIDALEQLRPVWAQGFSDESIAAQVSWAALSSIWKILGVNSQTEAVTALAEKDKRIAELEAELAKAREEISKRDHFLKARDTLLKEAQERVKALEIALVKAKAISPSNAIAWQERAEKAEADNAALRKELAKAMDIIEGKHLSTTGGGRMKLLKVTLKGEGRPYIVHIPFDKIVEIRTQAGSENVYCKVNGVEVKENYYDIITLLEAADAHE